MFKMIKKPLIFASVLSILSADIIISPTHPSYEFLINSIYEHHDSGIYTEYYPYVLARVDSTNNVHQAFLGVYSSFDISKGYPEHGLGLWSSTTWDRFSLYVEPRAVSEKYGQTLLGSDYSRAGFSLRINSSFLRYSGDRLAVQFGRGPVWWGQSWNASILQPRSAISYDHLSARFNIGAFYLEILSGQLNSGYLAAGDGTGKDRIKRYAAGHRLIWRPPNNKLIFTVGEQIIYSGQDRSLELFYMNPVIPYFFTALEGNEMENPDNDNSIVFLTGRYNLKSNFSGYFEFIVDDYQVDENNVPDAPGYKIGIDGCNYLLEKKLCYDLEYTSIGTWTYIHHGQYTSWQNSGHPLGYKYGPDCRSIATGGDYWFNSVTRFSVNYTWLEKGNNNLTTTWASPGTRDNPFPSLPATEYNFISVSAKRYWKYLNVELGYSNYPVGDAEIDGVIDTCEGSLFIKAQLVWGFGYDVE